MIILKDIEKRKELQQLVYDSYGTLDEKERKELDQVVGAALRGYELALGDIIRIIVNGHDDSRTIQETKDFITSCLNGNTTKNLFRFSELPDAEMLEYINTIVRDELINKGHSEKDACLICRSFAEYPSIRKSIIERNSLESISICDLCGAPIRKDCLVNDGDSCICEACAK